MELAQKLLEENDALALKVYQLAQDAGQYAQDLRAFVRRIEDHPVHRSQPGYAISEFEETYRAALSNLDTAKDSLEKVQGFVNAVGKTLNGEDAEERKMPNYELLTGATASIWAATRAVENYTGQIGRQGFMSLEEDLRNLSARASAVKNDFKELYQIICDD
jgi:vacuolar-type H+-ATPase catalytic subunit A/Vma1